MNQSDSQPEKRNDKPNTDRQQSGDDKPARSQLVRRKLKRPVLYIAIFAILCAVLTFQLASLYAQPDGSRDAGIYASPTLNVQMDSVLDYAIPGDIIIYEILYFNTGADGATGVFLDTYVPLYTTFVADGSSEGWDCGGSVDAGTECSLSVGTLVPNERNVDDIYFAVRVDVDVLGNTDVIDNEIAISDDGLNGPSEGGQPVDSVSVPIGGPLPEPTVAEPPTPTLAPCSLETESEPGVVGTPEPRKAYLPLINQ